MSDDESDVSAITLSDDDAPKQKPIVPQRQPPKSTARAGGSGQAAAMGSAADSRTAGAAERGKARIAFRLRADDTRSDDSSADGDGDGRAEDDGSGDAAAVKDESKPLGWSYFRKRDDSEGPVTWGEVDVNELRFVAENLVRSTTKRASQADGVIQQIFQAGPMGDDALVADPLGRGVIDPMTLTLGKRSKMVRMVQPAGGEKGLKATMRTFRTARLGSRAAAGGGEAGGGGGQAAAAGRALGEEARKVLPNQEGFDPEAYLATFHSESSMAQLDKGLRSLSRELSERTGQLKLLIRNNFDRFINCKDAIDDIHAKMRKMLVRGTAGGGGGGGPGPAAGAPGSSSSSAAAAATQLHLQQQQQGVGTDRVFRSLEQVEGQARRTLGPILDRAAKADRIRAVAGLLQRFDHLFASPQRIMELAGRGELEQVVREYTRANMFIRPTPTTARVWVSLYSEIEKRVTEVYLAVKQLVTEAPPEGRPMGQDGPVALFGVGPAAGAAPGSELDGAAGGSEDSGQLRLYQLPDYLLFLALVRQERLPAAREEDPMRLYVSRMETHVGARIQTCDKQHTDRLGLLVTSWMRASPGVAGAGGSGLGASGGGGGSVSIPFLRNHTAGGVASLQASVSSLSALAARGAADKLNGSAGDLAGAGGANMDDGGADDSGLEDDDDADDLDEDGEAAEAAFLLWRGGPSSSSPSSAASASPFQPTAAPLPYHIRTELRRLVQDPGGRGSGGGSGGGAGFAPGGGSLPAMLLYGGTGEGSAGGDGGGALEPLAASAHVPEPVLTSGQRQWVSYVCSISAVLLWSLPGLWATCNSLKYGSNGNLDEQAKEGLERGPSLARRLVEGLCKTYAVRLRRAAQSLARAGPMQPGLPLIIKDACHLWVSLRRLGIHARTLSALRGAVAAAMSAHVGVLGDHLAALPQLLFGADDFRLDLLAADQQPVTALPRRLEEEMGLALLHYQWPLSAVVEAAGGVEEVPAESSWKPMQGSVFACFSLLSEALAEYARGLYAGRSGGDDDGGAGSSFRSRTLSRPSSELEQASAAGTRGTTNSSATPRAGQRLPNGTTTSLVDEGPARGSLWSAVGGGSSSDDVRMLLIIGNSAVIRTRIMPGVVERHRKLLAPTTEASGTCQRRLRDLTAAMRRSNEALGSSYLARKEADVRAAVRRYVASATAPLLAVAPMDAAAAGVSAGAGAGATSKRSKAAATALLPGPSGPGAGCSALLQLLTGIHNEALAYSPSNLRSFMEALVEALVAEVASACQGLAAGSTDGGATVAPTVEQLAQLWADLEFLTSALQPLLTEALVGNLKSAQVALGTAVTSRQRARRYRPASTPAEAVAGIGDGEAVSEALRELLAPDVEVWLRRYAFNVRCFATASGTVGPAVAAAAAGGPEASRGGVAAASGVAAAGVSGREGGSRGGKVEAVGGSPRGRRSTKTSLQEPAASPKSQQQEGRRRVTVAATGDDGMEGRTGRARRAAVVAP